LVTPPIGVNIVITERLGGCRPVTFSQLRTFALVAELGSLRAAAAALGVSEPAVSAAVAALRADVGDPLFVRSGGGIALTPGGRALAGRARELVALEERTRREVGRAESSGNGLRVLASPSCAEHVSRLVDAFTERVPGAEVDLTVGQADPAQMLAEDRCDVALGPRPSPRPGQPLEEQPFLRYQRVVVAAPRHPLAGRAELPPAALSGCTWVRGPGEREPGTAEERFAAAVGCPVDVVHADDDSSALAAARAGRGLLLALGHLAAADLRRGTLVRLPIAGTPVTGLWWATVPGADAATPAARRLQRFLTTPDATAALLARPRRPDRPRPRVRVELWS
jgi:DNA-binding transcriptional LysR family regulator